MGKLDINRMSNSTKLSRVDNAHVALEGDLEEILGVPDNTEITNPIFGVTHDGEPPVQSDGSIRGIMKFYESAVEADVNSASGFEWTDGTETKRIVMVSSGMKVYELDGSTWTQVADLENPGSGSGLLANLGDMDPSLSPTSGQLLSWDAVNGWWEAVDAASGAGKTRFADLDDTPAAAAAAPGDPFNDYDVNKIVYVASTATLGFMDAPAGLGDPFCMLLVGTETSTGANKWHGTAGFQEIFNWGYQNYADDGGFLTDNSALLTNDGGDANKFITLEAGLYQINFWYNCTNPNLYGTRQWKVVGSNSDGPATLGIQNEANMQVPVGSSFPSALPGHHYLGSAMLIQFANGTIHFEAAQNSAVTLSGVTWYAAITKVK